MVWLTQEQIAQLFEHELPEENYLQILHIAHSDKPSQLYSDFGAGRQRLTAMQLH